MNPSALQPKVSVIVPVYNAGEALRSSVASICAQTYVNLELILVDDGSTDGSSELCDQLARSDDRVVVLHQSNSGVSSARNTGITAAMGEYLTFVDADDLLATNALATVVPRLLQDNSDFACFGMTFVHHDGERVVAKHVKSVEHAMLLDSPDALRGQFFELYELNYWSSACNKVFNVHFIRENRLLFDDRMALLEDFEFVVGALTCNPRITVLAEALYDYQINVTKLALSRRPNIDYLRNFRTLDASLDRLAIAIRINSSPQLGKLNAMLFRFYLIGVEMFFAQKTDHRTRYRNVRAYLSDARVLETAQLAQPTRRGVAVMAWLVSHHYTLLVYASLLIRGWAKNAERSMKVTVSKARIFLQGGRPSHDRFVRSRRTG